MTGQIHHGGKKANWTVWTTLFLAAVWGFQTAGLAQAGPYSSHSGPSSTIDDPIAGFIDGQVNDAFVAWADVVVDYSPANPGEMDAIWQNPQMGLAAVTGDRMHVVSLGELSGDDVQAGLAPGSITLGFSDRIYNGDGADFGVFENAIPGYGDWVFGELAYVEVSTDGEHFARFDPVSLTPEPVGAYLAIDATNVYNLAGKHAHGSNDAQATTAPSWATPFDLEELADHTLVDQGLLSVDKIHYVRLVDIPGTGDFVDSLGNPIYDPHETWGSGGFDLEAIGALRSASPGDMNHDGSVNLDDVDMLAEAISSGSDNLLFDYNGNGSVAYDDLDAILLSEFSSLLGDLNLDSWVGPSDAHTMIANMGQPGTYADGDIDGDGIVGFSDYATLSNRYGQRIFDTTVVPEPTSMALMLLATAAGLARRRTTGA